MNGEPNPIDEHLDMLAGTVLIYAARVIVLQRKFDGPGLTRREVREHAELMVRINQLHREVSKFIEQNS